MEREKEDISEAVRCCLMTFKNGTKLAALDTDYKSMEGRSIPFRQLGYATLESFIQTVSGIKTYKRGSDIWVESIPTKETAHISRLVAGQNQPKIRRRKTQLRYGSYNHGASRNGIRPVSLVQRKQPFMLPFVQPRTAANLNRNNNPPRPQVTIEAPKPLMQCFISLPPAIPAGIQREIGSPAIATALPTKIRQEEISPKTNVERNIIRPSPSFPEDARDKLRKIALQLGRGLPVYKIIHTKGKNGSAVYGKVEVGSSKFSSYPNEGKTQDEAEILAANQALEELTKEIGTTLQLVETRNKDLMKKRLLEIVDQHNGVFIHKIPAFYQEQFNESLPIGWEENISHWGEITLEKGVNDSVILCRANTMTKDKAHEHSPIIEKGFLKPIYHLEPAHLELPEEHMWVACVHLVTSTAEIWARLIGEDYSEKFECLMSEMSQYYSKMTTSADSIERGGYYGIMENEAWYRVRVLDYDLTCDEAEVFFIDIGDEDTINISRLYPLDRKFFSLPAQAIRISLAGLEDFADCDSFTPTIEKCILNSVFYMEDVKREIDEDGPSAAVIMYDTSGPDDININNVLKEKFLHACTPKLEGGHKVSPVHVSHVETNGDVFIQVKHDGLKALVKMLNKLIEGGLSTEDRRRSALERIDYRVIYLARCIETGDLYRAKFVEFATNNRDGARRLKMLLIDFGRTIIVDVGNVMQLDKLSIVLAEFPAQAIKVHLDKVESNNLTVKMIERMRELAPPSQLLLLKVVKPSSKNSLPVVELFKKMPPDNILGSINNTLVFEPECTKLVDEDGNNNVKPRKRVERANSRSTDVEETAKALRAPKIGDIGEYFDVHVTMAANPANFTVQPLESLEKLNKMMRNLQEACKNKNNVSRPTLESIKEGRLYAAQHTDGDWYRGCVLNVINDDMLMVYFVDYGDVAAMGLDKLLTMSKQFLDLPYQAIKARLVGIKPKRIDWSPEDCIRFRNLTVERNLVSIIAEVDADRHLPRDTVLGLSLIDVSTSEDIHIAEVLVNEGRAVYYD